MDFASFVTSTSVQFSGLICLLQFFLQMFSDYQMQQMSENFIDTFGFNDDEFNDGEEQVR
jgi:hypothetical protein